MPTSSPSVRDRLLEAARSLLASGGVDAVGIREVARRAEVSHGAPRRYFATRELLLAALAAEGFDELSAAVAEAVESADGARDRLVAAARAYVRFAVRDRARFELMFRHDVLAGSGADLRATSLVLLDLLRALLAQVREETPDDADVVRLWTAVHGIAVLAANRALEVVPGDVDTVALVRRTVLAHLADGDRPQPVEASPAVPIRSKPTRA